MEVIAMKSLWLGIVAAIAVAIVAGVILDSASTTSADKFTASSTRL
jgi:hypothetical protein